MRKSILIAAFICLASVSCTNDTESDLMAPDTDSPLTYESGIKQIISNNCLSCHSSPPLNGAPFALDNYERVRDKAENGNLIAAINRQTGEPAAMPPSGRMPQATINMIEKWADEGFREK